MTARETGNTAPPGTKAAPAATHQPSKVRAGMGDVGADFVEDLQRRRLRTRHRLLSILAPDGRARTADVPTVEPATWLRFTGACLLIRMLDERLMTCSGRAASDFMPEARGQGGGGHRSRGCARSERLGRSVASRGWRGSLPRLPLRAYIAQVLGNVDDIGKGRQMPVHPATRARCDSCRCPLAWRRNCRRRRESPGRQR